MSDSDQVNELTLEGLGQRLAQLRRDAQLSVEDVAGSLKLTVRVINALESANGEQLPSAVFAKGYYIAYGRMFGMQKTDVECYFINAFPSADSITQKHIEKIARKPSGDLFEKQGLNLKPLLIVVLLAAVVAVVLVGYESLHGVTPSASVEGPKKTVLKPSVTKVERISQGPETEVDQVGMVGTEQLETRVDDAPSKEDAVAQVSSSEPEQVAELSTESSLEVLAAVSADDSDTASVINDAHSDDVVEAAEASDPSNLASVETLSLTDANVRVIGEGAHQLQIKFNEKCWVQVTDSSGELLVSNSYDKGWELQVNTDEKLDVVLGYAHGVEVYYDQTPVKLRIRNSGSASLTL